MNNYIRLKGHQRAISFCCVLDDGRLLTGSYDGTAIIWNTISNEKEMLFEGHAGAITSGCILEGNNFCTASQDKTIRIWDNETGQCINILRGHTDTVDYVCYIEDDKLISSSCRDHTVRIWNIKSGKIKRIDQQHIASPRSILDLRDGTVAIGEGIIKIINLKGKILKKFNMKKCSQIIQFTDKIIIGLCERGIILKNIDNLNDFGDLCGDDLIFSSEIYQHVDADAYDDYRIRCMALLQNGNIIYGNSNGTFRIYDIKNKKTVARANFKKIFAEDNPEYLYGLTVCEIQNNQIVFGLENGDLLVVSLEYILNYIERNDEDNSNNENENGQENNDDYDSNNEDENEQENTDDE